MREKFCFLVTLLILAATGTLVTAHQDGIHGEFVKNGCACHGSAPSEEVSVAIDGLPSVYNASQVYPLTITVTGGPTASGTNHGGFNLRVGGGVLSKNSSDQTVLIAQQSMEATHTSSGTLQYSWNVTWTAPDNDVFLIEVRAFGNAVNGDGSPAGDEWAGLTTNVPGQNWTESSDDVAGNDLVFIAIAILSFVALAGLIVWKNWFISEE
ncbi:MAG TPA: choice-of-anchor V domain-containing protein [Candidatus Poseidoniales archaeon]|nr:choice-of-anchor V domain-containing protein [Candidatus Poseidoniales archaeon]